MALNRQELIKQVYRNAPNLQNVQNTKWGALQSIIEVNDHHAVARTQKLSPADVRMTRIVNGGGLVQQAFDYLSVV